MGQHYLYFNANQILFRDEKNNIVSVSQTKLTNLLTLIN
jgi:hypothetical protein